MVKVDRLAVGTGGGLLLVLGCGCGRLTMEDVAHSPQAALVELQSPDLGLPNAREIAALGALLQYYRVSPQGPETEDLLQKARQPEGINEKDIRVCLLDRGFEAILKFWSDDAKAAGGEKPADKTSVGTAGPEVPQSIKEALEWFYPQLQAGRPALTRLRKSPAPEAPASYVLLVGYDPVNEWVAVYDPEGGTSPHWLAEFAKLWGDGKEQVTRWLLVAHPPPASPAEAPPPAVVLRLPPAPVDEDPTGIPALVRLVKYHQQDPFGDDARRFAERVERHQAVALEEIERYLRRRRLNTGIVEGTLEAAPGPAQVSIPEELRAERPVLVQSRNGLGQPRIELVFGWDGQKQLIYLVDPRYGPILRSRELFWRDWQAGGAKVLVARPPRKPAPPLPADDD